MDKLELGQVLGTGGFGEVRLATLSTPGGLQRLVAVKLMHPASSDQDTAVRRLRAEARLLASLDHPTVVAVEDLTEIDGRLALVMEYVPGSDMMELMRAGDLPLRVALEALSQVADALHCAWKEQGIVHRDIKPHNIRLGPNGRVKLLDFGIAHAQEHTALTAEGLIAGSSGHMAPERYEADTQDTPASDVYALGCCLAAVLLGKPLWAGLNTHQQVALAFDADRHDRALAKRLAPIEQARIRGLLTQMLAWHHEDRPSAEVVSQALERAAATQPGLGLRSWARARTWPEVSQPSDTSGTIELPEPLTASTPRRSLVPVLLGLLVLAGLLLASVSAVGVGLLLGQWPDAQPSQPEAQAPAVTEPVQPVEQPAEAQESPVERPARRVQEPVAQPVVQPVAQPEVDPARPAPEQPSAPPVAVLISTVPMGAALSIDGQPIGPTPQTVELPAGPHAVTVTTASGEQRTTIEVQPEGNTRHIWRESSGSWSASR